MSRSTNNADRNLDEFLQEFGGRAAVPPGMSARTRSACLSTLNGFGRTRRAGLPGLLARPALLSTLGLAAALVLAVGLFFPSGGGPSVRAAVVLEKLATQVQGEDVLEVALDAVSVDEVSVQGRIQIAEKAIAGDIHATIRERTEEAPIEVDASWAISEAGGWVLLRKLVVPTEPEAAAIIAGLFPPGTETLLTLPASTLTEIAEKEAGDEVGSELGKFRSLATGQLATFLKEVINSQADVGATVANQQDGTVLVTIAVHDAESLRKLMQIAKTVMGEKIDGEIDMSDDAAKEFLGCTLRVVYDPAAQAVRSFSVSDLGEMKGTVTISLRGGAIDAALLDPARVTTPNTRRLDAGVLMEMVKALQEKEESAE